MSAETDARETDARMEQVKTTVKKILEVLPQDKKTTLTRCKVTWKVVNVGGECSRSVAVPEVDLRFSD